MEATSIELVRVRRPVPELFPIEVMLTRLAEAATSVVHATKPTPLRDGNDEATRGRFRCRQSKRCQCLLNLLLLGILVVQGRESELLRRHDLLFRNHEPVAGRRLLVERKCTRCGGLTKGSGIPARWVCRL